MNSVDGDVLLPKHFEFKQVFFDRMGESAYLSIAINKERKEILDSKNPIETLKSVSEKELIIKVLEDCNNNKSKASRVLKIARPLLYQKMKRLNIDM